MPPSIKKIPLSHLNVTNKRVLLRVDFNVPFNKQGDIADESRIVAALPSIQSILSRGGKAIVMSHLGRPQGNPNPAYSLAPCAKRLSELLKRPVPLAPDCIGEKIEAQTKALQKGEVMMLENLRFHREEEVPEETHAFAKALSRLGDVYVNDAFGASHRNHSSIVVIPEFFQKKSAMGLLMEKEIAALSKLISHPGRPFFLILGGAKLKTKVGLLSALLPKIDGLFIGGGMAFTFLKALGVPIGDSVSEQMLVPKAQEIIEKCRRQNIPLHLPEDCVIAKESEHLTIKVDEGIPLQWKGMDIGPQTISSWSSLLQESKTLFWNGPMGVFEVPLFAKGTKEIAKITSDLDATTIVGGGDSIGAIRSFHLEKKFTHLSTGGGASLAYLEHGHLPGIEALSPFP